MRRNPTFFLCAMRIGMVALFGLAIGCDGSYPSSEGDEGTGGPGYQLPPNCKVVSLDLNEIECTGTVPSEGVPLSNEGTVLPGGTTTGPGGTTPVPGTNPPNLPGNTSPVQGATPVPPAVNPAGPTGSTITPATNTVCRPEIKVKPAIEIWPPNHKYVLFHRFNLSDCATVSDPCNPKLNLNDSAKILSLYSDEPEDSKGDGKTSLDMEILDTSTFRVRAERQGGGNGRVYGVTFSITNSQGNSSTATCHVAVPHSKSGAPAIDDGAAAGYTIH